MAINIADTGRYFHPDKRLTMGATIIRPCVTEAMHELYPSMVWVRVPDLQVWVMKDRHTERTAWESRISDYELMQDAVTNTEPDVIRFIAARELQFLAGMLK